MPSGERHRTAGWSSSQINTLAGKRPVGATALAALGVDTTYGNFTFGGSLTQPMTLNKLGPNTLTLTGANTIPVALSSPPVRCNWEMERTMAR